MRPSFACLASLAFITSATAQQLSRDSRCGDYNGRTCKGTQWGSCCSVWGYCGSSAEHCEVQRGCQNGYGDCTSNDNGAVQVISPNGRCGAASGYTCKGSDDGNCCSQYGYCGSTTEYCSAGCQPLYGDCASTASSRLLSASSKQSSTVPKASSIALPDSSVAPKASSAKDSTAKVSSTQAASSDNRPASAVILSSLVQQSSNVRASSSTGPSLSDKSISISASSAPGLSLSPRSISGSSSVDVSGLSSSGTAFSAVATASARSQSSASSIVSLASVPTSSLGISMSRSSTSSASCPACSSCPSSPSLLIPSIQPSSFLACPTQTACPSATSTCPSVSACSACPSVSACPSLSTFASIAPSVSSCPICPSATVCPSISACESTTSVQASSYAPSSCPSSRPLPSACNTNDNRIIGGDFEDSNFFGDFQGFQAGGDSATSISIQQGGAEGSAYYVAYTVFAGYAGVNTQFAQTVRLCPGASYRLSFFTRIQLPVGQGGISASVYLDSTFMGYYTQTDVVARETTFSPANIQTEFSTSFDSASLRIELTIADYAAANRAQDRRIDIDQFRLVRV